MEGCSFLKLKKDEYPDYDSGLAKEVILSYLTEKYDKEFSIINEPRKMTDTILFGNVWYTYEIMVEDDKNNENSDIYEVSVEYENGEYNVSGDTFLNYYYEKLFYEYTDSIIADCMGEIPYITIFISGTANREGFAPTEKIPESKNDLSNYFRNINFRILIPQTYDNDRMSSICSSLYTALANEYFNVFIGSIMTYSDDNFNDIFSAEKPYSVYVEKPWLNSYNIENVEYDQQW